MNIFPASLVKATAGREKGKYFVVTKVLDESFVLICDSRRRKVASPKKKKIIHLENLSYSLDLIKNNLESGNEISDSHLRKSIRKGLTELGIIDEE